MYIWNWYNTDNYTSVKKYISETNKTKASCGGTLWGYIKILFAVKLSPSGFSSSIAEFSLTQLFCLQLPNDDFLLILSPLLYLVAVKCLLRKNISFLLVNWFFWLADSNMYSCILILVMGYSLLWLLFRCSDCCRFNQWNMFRLAFVIFSPFSLLFMNFLIGLSMQAIPLMGFIACCIELLAWPWVLPIYDATLADILSLCEPKNANLALSLPAWTFSMLPEFCLYVFYLVYFETCQILSLHSV